MNASNITIVTFSVNLMFRRHFSVIPVFLVTVLRRENTVSTFLQPLIMTSVFHSLRLSLRKVAVAMHCNLEPPDVATVVLAFNYEAQI